MRFDLDIKRAKAIARALKRRQAPDGTPIGHTQVLDALSEGLGFRNWNTLRPRLDAAPASSTAPRIPGQARHPDTLDTARFDAACVLEDLSDSELAHTIELLESCGYADDDPTIALAEAAVALPGHDDLDAVIRAGNLHDAEMTPRLSIRIDAEAARGWLSEARPGLHADLVAKGVIETLTRADLLDGRLPVQGPSLAHAAGNALIELTNDAGHGPHELALIVTGGPDSPRVLAARGYRYASRDDDRLRDVILFEIDGEIWSHGDIDLGRSAGSPFAFAGSTWTNAEAALEKQASTDRLVPYAP